MDVQVILMDLPPKVNACHTLNEDGSYTIVLDARATYEQRKESFNHEMSHIKSEDLFQIRETADQYEYNVRNKKSR